jgi:molybdopterin-containing oxidoreductase family membrane subunit
LPEILLGIGGVAIALFVILFAIKLLKFLPTSLADEDVDPHYKANSADQ